MEPTAFNAAVATIQAGLRQYVATRPIALQDMYLARFLPPVRGTAADIKGGGNFRITTQPAALTAVDSPYFKVGGLKLDNKEAVGFKITAEVKLSESNQDQMHEAAQNEIVRAYSTGATPNVQSIYEGFIARLNEDGVLLSLDYGEEQYRALTLAYGKLDVIDGNTGLAATADFKVPDTNKVERTIAAGDAYHLPGSKFWDDVQTARERLNVEPVAITDPETWQVARAEAIWQGRGPRILTVGSLKPVKNHALLLRAFARLAMPQARLMIVGQGPEEGSLRQLVAELGLGQRVILAGFHADPAALYATADLFALSSDHEGFGNVLVEALSYGLPVVSTDCPAGPAEILGGGRWGGLVPVGDEEALAGAMAAALSAPVDRDALRARAADFAPEIAARKYLDLVGLS